MNEPIGILESQIVKIVSDGSRSGTHVFVDGEPIKGYLRSVEFRHGGTDLPSPQCVLTFYYPHFQYEGPVEVKAFAVRDGEVTPIVDRPKPLVVEAKED